MVTKTRKWARSELGLGEEKEHDGDFFFFWNGERNGNREFVIFFLKTG